MLDKFETLLKELSKTLDTPLKVDSNNSCLIIFDNELQVQLELDDSLENLIVFSSVCTLPPGKFRENVLLEALKQNDKFPYIAIFAYLEKNNSLVLFNNLNFSKLTAEILSSYLSLFTDLAFMYKDAINKGQTTPVFK